jgi:hypothetical protein
MRLQREMATNAMIRISVEDSRQRASGTALVLAVQGDGFVQASNRLNVKLNWFRSFSGEVAMT